MPIGSAKIGVLGAGTVPGGTQTFNASGTFTVPPGVSKVNITGVGGVGNPGNAGNAGNAGNPGSGAAGGGGGSSTITNPGCNVTTSSGSVGGDAFKVLPNSNLLTPAANYPSVLPNIAVGGAGSTTANTTGCAGAAGAAGQAGSAGTAGNPGNSGQASSGLCKTFPGGAGGNAGAGGAAGNAGAAGTGGSGGGGSNQRNPGAGGTGGGSGGAGGSFAGSSYPFCPGFVQRGWFAGVGGGGAGAVNSGQNGGAAFVGPPCSDLQSPGPLRVPTLAKGGTGNACVTGPLPKSSYHPGNQPVPVACGIWPLPTAMMGGLSKCGEGFTSIALTPQRYTGPSPVYYNRNCINNINPAPLRPEIVRSGSGGGMGSSIQASPNNAKNVQLGGGAGGGGRGGVGGAGGNSSAPSGSAGTPNTFNCVSVTPGSPYPIVVGSPGGQVVISWNPQ